VLHALVGLRTFESGKTDFKEFGRIAIPTLWFYFGAYAAVEVGKSNEIWLRSGYWCCNGFMLFFWY
jgi:hypothetical protein